MCDLDKYEKMLYYGFVMVDLAGYEIGGFTNGAGHLADRRVPHGIIFIPGKIWVTDDTLEWEFEPSENIEHRKPTGSILQRFIALAGANGGSAVERFAKRWGPLRFPLDGYVSADSYKRGTESLRYWKFLAQRASAVLSIASELRQDRFPREEHLKRISTPHDDSIDKPEFFGFGNWARRERCENGEYGKELSIDRLKSTIEGELTDWLARFPPKLSIAWNPKVDWHLEVQYGGTFLPAVALQLALTVAGGDLFTCDGCHEPYIRAGRRRPNAGQQNFCSDCGVVEALRSADIRRREKKAEARKLFGSGESVAQISRELGTNRATIAGWVKKGKRS